MTRSMNVNEMVVVSKVSMDRNRWLSVVVALMGKGRGLTIMLVTFFFIIIIIIHSPTSPTARPLFVCSKLHAPSTNFTQMFVLNKKKPLVWASWENNQMTTPIHSVHVSGRQCETSTD